MLPRKNRLQLSGNIQNVFNKGKFVRGDFLFLKYTPNKETCTRFAFSVGTKYSKKAVKRNRFKRILREGIKKLLVNMPPGFDIIICNKSASDKEEPTLKIVNKELKKILIKSKILN